MNLFSCADVAGLIGCDESTIRRQAARAWQKHGGPGPLLKHRAWVVVCRSSSEGGRGCGWQLKRAADFSQGAWAVPTAAKPGDQELYDYWISTSPQFGCADPVGFARAVLARWGHQPIGIEQALIKAECALSDIAEGEPEPGSGSAELLQWAEQRCGETLAIIRPVMKQHQIRTSEWPPLPADALPLPSPSRENL